LLADYFFLAVFLVFFPLLVAIASPPVVIAAGAMRRSY
jgi:hypothetical protein